MSLLCTQAHRPTGADLAYPACSLSLANYELALLTMLTIRSHYGRQRVSNIAYKFYNEWFLPCELLW